MLVRPASLIKDESGQGLVEYSLVLALVAVGLIAILLSLRNAAGNVYNHAATQVEKSATCGYGSAGGPGQSSGSGSTECASTSGIAPDGGGDGNGNGSGNGSGNGRGNGNGDGNGNGNGNGKGNGDENGNGGGKSKP